MNQPLPVLQPSVGLPFINRPLDNTALSAYMACPREYYLSMVQHRRAEGRRSPALAFGGAIHKALEYHYKGLPAEAIEMMVTAWWEKHGHDDPTDHRTLARVLLDFRKYREKWGHPPNTERAVCRTLPI